jgi:predicted RecB family nuclease
MAKTTGSRRVCPKGHTYIKSSDCPTCPKCEAERAPTKGFISAISAPARRALEGAGLTTLKKLAKACEADVAELHGMGPKALGILKAALKAEGLAFRKKPPGRAT